MPGTFLFLLLFGVQAWAFEPFPEYQSLTEDELDRPDKIDSEYASNWLTFQKPVLWDLNFYSHNVALDISTGSLSSKQFYSQDRLQLHQHLNPAVEFRFTYFSQRDFDEDRQHQILEFIYWTKNRTGLSAYGSTSLFKAENDVGLALISQHHQDREIRVFTQWPDFQRNQRSLENDQWVKGHSPFILGLNIRYLPTEKIEHRFRQFNLRHEFPSSRRFPTEEYQYHHQHSSLSLTFLEPLGFDFIEGRLLLDRKFEEVAPTSGTSTQIANNTRRQRALLMTGYRYGRRVYEINPGLSFQYREYRQNLGQISYRDVLPYFWLSLKPEGESDVNRVLSLGLDSTFHSESQDPDLQNLPRNKYKNEYRLNLKYEFKFKDQGNLAVLFCFDGDRLGSGGTWEAGNMQFNLFY